MGADTYRTRQPSFTSWSQDTLDEGALLIMMDTIQIQASEDPDVYANNTALAIKNACDVSMLRKRKGGKCRKPVQWWNEDIADARRQCLVARRHQQRSRGRPNFLQLLENYRERRAILKKAIKRSKALCWENLCAEADEQPFGTAYKVVMGKLARRPMPTDPEQLLDIVTTLFPEHPAANLVADIQQTAPKYTEITEIREATANIKVNKAPGPDEVPSKVVKTIATNHPALIANLFNVCIRQRTVPKRWKLQRLELLPKGGNVDDPSAYRPLCMLDVVGKLFERIKCNRLDEELEERRGISDWQYGFRKKRSTIDAINAVVKIASKAIEL
ncbi:hypothetical protein ACLKA7_000211 [Drosophila subpalustris]